MYLHTLVTRIYEIGLEAQMIAHELAGNEKSLSLNAFDLAHVDDFYRGMFILGEDGNPIDCTEDSIEERLSEISAQYARYKAKRDAWTKCIA